MKTIGVDVGGTSVRAAVVAPDGSVIEAIRAATPNREPELDYLLAGVVRELAAKHRVSAVGLAIAGFLSADLSRVMFAPHLPWRDAPVAARLAAQVGLPVVMDHDVNCAAWAECRLGAARGHGTALVIALGTGIGAGLVVDGRLYRGGYGVAPELGHLPVMPNGRQCACGKRGCLERYCSGTALVADAREAIAAGEPTTLAEVDAAGALSGRAVERAARAGDRLALELFAGLGRWLGLGMAIAADMLDPESVVIGGGVCAAADLFLPTARREYLAHLTGRDHRPQASIDVASFGARASVVGAGLIAADLMT